MALKNKLGITNSSKLAEEEEKITKKKALELFDKKIIENFEIGTFKGLQEIHKYLFQDIYYFAGKIRDENISKGEFRFASFEYIESELNRLMEELKSENYLEGLNKEELAKRLAYYLSELNVLHPFREGNGRTTREFIRQLALKNGYKLNLSKVMPEEVLNASIESIVDTKHLEKIFNECLEK